MLLEGRVAIDTEKIHFSDAMRKGDERDLVFLCL